MPYDVSYDVDTAVESAISVSNDTVVEVTVSKAVVVFLLVATSVSRFVPINVL